MTNTLHRQGSAESLKGDYVVFAMSAKGYNREGCADQLKEFMRIALRHKPVAVRAVEGGVSGLAEPEKLIGSMTDLSAATATYDNLDAVRGVVADLVNADLGISINISGLLEEAAECCRAAGINRHSVEHSLGFRGRLERLPSAQVLQVNTMCGHGLVSFNLIKKVLDYIKLDRMTPEKGAQLLAKPCVCGAFNPTRAALLLREMKEMS